MVRGIIYGYYQKGEIMYIGRTIGPYTTASVLNTRHYNHLRGDSPFDIELQLQGEAAFELKIIKEIVANKLSDIYETIKTLERHAIISHNPRYNVVRNYFKEDENTCTVST